MELRWLVLQHPKPSLGYMTAYASNNGLTSAQAKRELIKRDIKKLQYRDHNADWVDVPTVYQPAPIED